MDTYNKILVVVDLSPDSHLIVERAKSLIAGSTAQLTLLHVVEYVPLEPIGETLMPALEIEGELTTRATQRLRELATHHGLSHCTQLVVVGGIKMEIQYAAEQGQVDLIVVGNHGRQGLKAILNFTEDAVLHSASCDVLAVRLPTQRS